MQKSTEHAIVYLHGFPGGPEELSLFGPPPAWVQKSFLPDRANDRPDLAAPEYFGDLAARASAFASGRPLHLIGFSLGARAALEIAARLGSSVERIDLISPAGPLDDNTHIDQMAGRAVFKAASSYPRLFRGITAVQAWTARHRPALLYRALFGRTGEASIDVCDFRARSIDLLQASFADGSAGYEREVLAYVGPWSDLPRQVMASTHIWQGTTDNWAPPEMARHLQTLLPRAALQMIEGQSHYGTLRHVLDQLDIK